MTNLFQTKEQISVMTKEQCQTALDLLEKTYKLDRPIQEYFTENLWDQLDDVIDTLLYLEDRLHFLNDLRFTENRENA